MTDIWHDNELDYFNTFGQYDSTKLEAMENIHLGERVFIVGNGPSLRDTDTSKLKDEISFGVNKIFLDTRFTPTYWVLQDLNSLKDIPDNGYDIFNTKSTIILDAKWRHFNKKGVIPEGEFIEFRSEGISKIPKIPRWPAYPSKWILRGNTSLFSCIQLAWYMGCREFYLIGVDFNYEPPPEINDHDINHFHPEYGYNGKTCNVNHSMEVVELAFKSAAHFIPLLGGSIKNASAFTKLDCIEKVDYESLWTS